jgi:hypothetical protein
MFKKILAGIVVTGLAGALVIGAAARTAGIASNTGYAGAQHQGRGQSAEAEGSGQGQRRGQSGDSEAEQGNYGGGAANGGERSRGNAGNGGLRGGQGQADAAAYANEWLTLSGTVLNVDANALSVSLASGEQMVVDGRAWSYAQEQGFTAQPGDALTLTGFYDGDTFEVGRIENLTQQVSVTLRDDSGRPQWAGGRGNGNR